MRERTPLDELPPARRQRKKNEGKGRARALGRLDPLKHEQYREAKRTRKKEAALRAARGEQVVWGEYRFRAQSRDISLIYFLQISRAAGRYFGKFLRPGSYSMCAARGETSKRHACVTHAVKLGFGLLAGMRGGGGRRCAT